MSALMEEAVTHLHSRIGTMPHTGLILGSGLGRLVQDLRHKVRVPFGDIPGFPRSSVQGHAGEIVCGNLSGTPLYVQAGRVHYYEGLDMGQVAVPMRVMAGLGIKRVIITNAAGAVNQSYRPGDLVSINDHINFMGNNPLRGSADFVDLTQVYSSRLRKLAHQKARELGITLHSGVYCAFAGPCYETPAEIRAVRVLGADLVGMSTVPEAITAASLGVEVLGLSAVTNMAAGITGQKLSHAEVIQTSARASERFIKLVSAVVAGLGGQE